MILLSSVMLMQTMLYYSYKLHTWPPPPVVTLQLTRPETWRPRQTLGAYEKVGEQSDNGRV